MHVIDHTKGQPSESETRNVLTESARIARGKITDLARLSAADHDAAIFPGGFGAAKNLSTFAVDGKDCRVHKDVERVLKEFHEAGKPIGLCCIAPVLAAKVLRGVEVTVGHEQEEGGKWPYAGTAEAIKALGAKHCVKGVTISFLAARVAVAVAPGTPPLALKPGAALPGAPGSTCVTRVGSDAGTCPSLAVFPSRPGGCGLGSAHPRHTGPPGQASGRPRARRGWLSGWEAGSCLPVRGVSLRPTVGWRLPVDGSSTGGFPGFGGSSMVVWTGASPVASFVPDPPAGARALCTQSLRPGPTTTQVHTWTQTQGTEQHGVPEGAGDNTVTLGVCLEGAFLSLEGCLAYRQFRLSAHLPPAQSGRPTQQLCGWSWPGAFAVGPGGHLIGRGQGQSHQRLASARPGRELGLCRGRVLGRTGLLWRMLAAALCSGFSDEVAVGPALLGAQPRSAGGPGSRGACHREGSEETGAGLTEVGTRVLWLRGVSGTGRGPWPRGLRQEGSPIWSSIEKGGGAHSGGGRGRGSGWRFTPATRVSLPGDRFP
uniref:DJ-1/PfpI domain-containing protein n=1 Tax=Panthera leo TaxID=9689 RepID=A0A8C8XY70_PANLE